MSVENGTFIDTNVLIHLLSSDQKKSDIAEQIVEQGGSISIQVLNELTNITREKLSLSWNEIREFTDTIRTICTIYPMTERTYDLGARLAVRYQLSVYDAMIVASAVENDDVRLFSEGMQNGFIVDKTLIITNPFA